MENSQNIVDTSNGTNNSSAIIRHDLIGQTIAEKYQVKRLLGRGGMGAVYEGIHLLLEKPVAIKVMSTELAEDQAALSRFMREAKTAAKLEHPNAVTIHDFGVWQDNVAYIVMEFISGIALRDVLEQHKTISPLDTVKWLSQVCSAVAAAHNIGIIHRDLKPENIMLKQSGESDPIIKVVDFGLAKIIKDEEGNASNITKTGEVFGTPYYMGPEFYDAETVDHQADIYALGVIAYEMLSGRPPFNGTIEKIIAAHLFQNPRPLAEINPDLAPFDPVIAQALKKKRDERLSSATEFANLLKNVLNENPSLVSARLGVSANPAIAEFAPTMKQASGAITIIPKTSKISNEIQEAHQTLENEASKTQANQIGTTKVAITSQMAASALDGIVSENFASINTQSSQKSENFSNPYAPSGEKKTYYSPTTSENSPTPPAKKLPLMVGIAVGVLMAASSVVYLASKPISPTTPNSIATPITISPQVTPVVKFSESENLENKTNTTTPNTLGTEDINKTEETKKLNTSKSKTTPKENSADSKNASQENRKDDKNIIVDAAGGIGKGTKKLFGLFGKGDKDKKEDKKDKKDKKRKDDN
jgi:serine/threonine-protein kinase